VADDSDRRLAAALDGVLDSYRVVPRLANVGGTRLPSREEVATILDDLLSLCFPGFFGREQLGELNARYVVGERCARVLTHLEAALVRAFVLEACGCRTPETDLDARAREESLAMLEALPEIRRLLATDIGAAFKGDPAATSPEEVITSYPGILAIAGHRIAHHLWVRCVPLVPRLMSEIIHSRTGIDIHPGAKIGEGFFIDHGTGVVIGETCVIGTNVKLYQGVTLGAHSVDVETPAESRGAHDPKPQRHPTLEDDVTVYAGATILGGGTVIGRGSTIGGNVWLTHGVPPGTSVVMDPPTLRYRTSG
jgi:serine O-acetyltransferase